MNDWMQTVFTDGTRYFVSNPLPKKGETITLWLRICEWSPVQRIILRTKLNGVEVLMPMEWDYSRNGLAYFKASLTLWEDLFHYHFYLVTEEQIYYYTQNGLTDFVPDEVYDFKILTDYQQPEWVKEAVFYQIFPERFCNGNPFNDVLNGEYSFDGHPAIRVRDWNQVPAAYQDSFCMDFYGGDLDGILLKIPYLKELGVNAVYLNPIFYAATVHKYDCLDYFTVDPHFGGDEALARLCQALHENGMKIILDISINHTGTAHKWFNKEGLFFPTTVGAYHNPDAKEREYYFFQGEHGYKSWYDVETLPTLNYTSQALRDVIYRKEDSVLKKWLKKPYQIDGWRFDVADIMARNDELQLHHEIWPEIRESIKEINPQAYILAEDWCDCAEFLRGNEWDSPMNYFGCARPVREFAGEQDLFHQKSPFLQNAPHHQDGAVLAARIGAHLNKLPTVIQQNQFNLIDSHDTPRLHNNPDISRGAWKNAALIQFALPGCVSIYYGDEAGIDGRIQDTEGCRYPMPWGTGFEKEEPYQFYSRLIQIRKSTPAFSEGSFQILYALGGQFICARFTDTECYLICCSMEKKECQVRFSVRGLGQVTMSGVQDLLGQYVQYELSEDGWMQIWMPAEAGYVMRLG
ncbi:MAG: alpha-amylase family glycosyl hydrolase [Lachnospiraceae bacterium]|nr:alpha-amylase family glycosyl hydrolase [Lachnospiraceae bacterium]